MQTKSKLRSPGARGVNGLVPDGRDAGTFLREDKALSLDPGGGELKVFVLVPKSAPAQGGKEKPKAGPSRL